MVGGCYVRHVISVGWHREPPTDGKSCHVKVANHNATSSAIGPATAIEWSNDRRAKSSRCSKRQPMSSPLSLSLCLLNKHIGCRFRLLIFSYPRMNVCYDLMFSFFTKLRWRNQRCYFFPPSFHQTKKKKIGSVSTAQGRVRGQADVNTF